MDNRITQRLRKGISAGKKWHIQKEIEESVKKGLFPKLWTAFRGPSKKVRHSNGNRVHQ